METVTSFLMHGLMHCFVNEGILFLPLGVPDDIPSYYLAIQGSEQ